MNQKQNSMTSNFNNYTRFVNTVTSTPSKDSDAFIYRLQELGGDVAIQRLLTASVGISAESCLLYTSPSPRD